MAVYIKNEQFEMQLTSMGISKSSLTYFRNPDFISFLIRRVLNPTYQQSNIHADQEEFIRTFTHLVASPNFVPGKIYNIYLPDHSNPNETLFLKLISFYNANVIPENKLTWISQTNIRQTAFLHTLTKYIDFNAIMAMQNQSVITGVPINFGLTLVSSILPQLNNPEHNRKSFIDSFNFLEADLKAKLTSIERIKSHWEWLLKINTSPRWIEKEGSDLFHSWLRGNGELINNPSFGWVFNDVNYSDKNAIVTFFDILYSHNPALGELTLRKIKNAWTQAKFREKNKDRVQFNFLMDSRVSALESASFFPKISSSHLKSITSSLDFHYDHSRTC